jgi:hypothetical protein
MPTMAPKAFISHAGEDKERIVLEFASELLSNGVQVWLDKWELGAATRYLSPSSIRASGTPTR